MENRMDTINHLPVSVSEEGAGMKWEYKLIHWVNKNEMNAEETVATEIILLEAEREIDRLKAELNEVKAVLELERKFHLKIAFRADKLHLQLQAIRDSAFGELCSLTAGEPENMGGIQEIE